MTSLLEVADPSEQHARVADQQTPGLEQYPEPDLTERRNDRGRIIADRKGERHRRREPVFLRPPIATPAGEGRFVNNSDSASDAEKLERVFLFQFHD